MKIAIEFQNLKLRVPENCNELPIKVIVGDGGGGPEPTPSGSFIRQLFIINNIIQSTSSISGHGEVTE